MTGRNRDWVRPATVASGCNTAHGGLGSSGTPTAGLAALDVAFRERRIGVGSRERKSGIGHGTLPLPIRTSHSGVVHQHANTRERFDRIPVFI